MLVILSRYHACVSRLVSVVFKFLFLSTFVSLVKVLCLSIDKYYVRSWSLLCFYLIMHESRDFSTMVRFDIVLTFFRMFMNLNFYDELGEIKYQRKMRRRRNEYNVVDLDEIEWYLYSAWTLYFFLRSSYRGLYYIMY